MALKHPSLALLGVASILLATFNSHANQYTTTDERLTNLEQNLALLERNMTARSRAQVDLVSNIDTLQNEINELRGITEEHNYKLGQILERQRELYLEIEKRLSSLKTPAEPVSATSPMVDPTQLSTVDVQISDNLNESEAYDRAVNLVLKDKRYDQAIPEFQSFIQTYPSSVYQPNAHYWLGQLLFNKSELTQASIHFNTVLEQFPDSTKRCDAMLKLAMVEQKQQNIGLAKQKYQKVIDECPSSSPARLASNRLAQL